MAATVGSFGGPVSIASGSSPRSVSVDIGTRTDGLLLVATNTNDDSDSVTGITYGGQAMTEVASLSAGSVTSWKLYALKNPPNGSNTLSIAYTGDGAYVGLFTWIALDGVDQTTPYGAAYTNIGSGTSFSLPSQTPPTDGLLIGMALHNFSGSDATTSSGTQHVSGRILSRPYVVASRSTTGTFAWSAASSNAWSAIGVPVNAAAGAVNGNASGATVTGAASLIPGAASGSASGSAAGVTLPAAASLVAGSASGATNATATGATVSAAASLIAGSASGVVYGTLNFQAAGMEFGRRTGLGIGTFALDAGASYRYTVHADGLTLGAAIITSAAENLDSAGKLANLTSALLTQGITYRIVAIRQADGEAATFPHGGRMIVVGGWPGRNVVGLNGRFGVRPAAFAVGGDFPNPLLNDFDAGDETTEFVAVVQSLPGSGVVVFQDDGGFSHADAADGSYSTVYRLFTWAQGGPVTQHAPDATISTTFGGAGATASGVTLAAAASLMAGTAAGGGFAPSAITQAAASLIAGTAIAGAQAQGLTLQAAASLVAGSAAGASQGTALGALVAAHAALLAGAASGQISATANGVLFTASAELVPGNATAASIAHGALFNALASLIAGSATGEASGAAPGRILTAVAVLIAGGAFGPNNSATPGYSTRPENKPRRATISDQTRTARRTLQ